MEKDRASGKLAVILHADIAGSTTLMQLDEQLAHERIRDAFHRFSDTIHEYHGQVRELRGDALLAEFARASDAVTAALAFQAGQPERLAAYRDTIKPVIRIGIALGEVVIADNTVSGTGVVLAQRVEQLADAGGICITAAIHEALPARLPFSQHDLGDQSLKGFAERVRVYRVEMKPGEPIPPPAHEQSPGDLSRKRFFGITAAVIVLAVASGAYLLSSRPGEQGPHLSGKPAESRQTEKISIAVLPFANNSNDPEQEYFVDGMTEDVITDLSRLSGLFVIAQSTVAAFKNQTIDARQAGQELGVGFVLQGSVRKSGNQLRISARLVETASGGQLWAERYDRQLKDLFAIQDEIAASIASALKIHLGARESTALRTRATIDFEAYDLFLRGQRAFTSRTRENIAEAINLYRRAIEIDPGYSRAYGAMAVAMTFQYRRGFTDTPLETINLALELAQNAATMDEKIPQVYWALGYVHLFRREFDKAVGAVQKAIEISPNYADAFGLLALIYNQQGNAEGAIRSITRAMELNPYYSYDYPYNLGRAYYLAGRYQEAIDNLNRALDKNETAPTPRIYLIASYVRAGMIDDAEWEAENLKIQNPEMTISQLRKTSAQADELLSELVADLRKAGVQE